MKHNSIISDNFYPVHRRATLDRVILVLAALFLLAGIILLYRNSRTTYSLRNVEEIATVGVFENQITRRITGTLSWIGVAKGDILYNGDEILTNKDSNVTVRFKDKSELIIGPQSLVRLDITDNEFKIEMVKGVLEIKKTPGSKIKVVERASGKEIKITSGKSIKSPLFGVKKRPLIKETIPPVQETIPPVQETIPPVQETIPPVQEAPVVVKALPAPKPAPVKKVEEVAPGILPEQIMNFNGDEENPSYQIKLLKNPLAEKYFLEVYADAALKKPVLKVITKTPEYNWVSRRSGKFYYRVRIQDSNGRMSVYSSKGILLFPISPLEEL